MPPCSVRRSGRVRTALPPAPGRSTLVPASKQSGTRVKTLARSNSGRYSGCRGREGRWVRNVDQGEISTSEFLAPASRGMHRGVQQNKPDGLERPGRASTNCMLVLQGWPAMLCGGSPGKDRRNTVRRRRRHQHPCRHRGSAIRTYPGQKAQPDEQRSRSRGASADGRKRGHAWHAASAQMTLAAGQEAAEGRTAGRAQPTGHRGRVRALQAA